MKTDIVYVESPSRLHITLIDMHGSYSGRVDGGAGLAISSPSITLAAHKLPNREINIEVNSQTRLNDNFLLEIKTALASTQALYGLGGIFVYFENVIPAHSGFGSKTQTLLATLGAYAKLYQLEVTPRELAFIAGRGGTSGIGVEAFNSGGFIVDCGHSFDSKGLSFRPSSRSRRVEPAPLVGRYHFPDWPILIVTPSWSKHIYGDEEQRLFNEVCPIQLVDVQMCSHIVLMMLIPSVIEANIETFCKGINLIQELKWKSFEIDAQPVIVRQTMQHLREIGIDCVGMSSWGPTLFGLGSILNNKVSAQNILQQVGEFLNPHGGGTYFITSANSSGARINMVTN